MKLAMIGSYGHTRHVTGSAAFGKEAELVAAARFGGDDTADYAAWKPAGRLDVYDDYRRMLRDARPDVVSVCMPLWRNAEASIAAAEAGCHVFSDKPLATTLDDLARLREAVSRAGVRIAAMFNLRCEPAFQAARDAVRAGRIGRPVLASAQKSYPFGRRDDNYRSRKTYGGTIPWVASHALEYISYCTGQDYVRVAAMHSNVSLDDYPGTEDNGGLLLELEGGGHAVIRFDYLRPKAEGVSRRHGDDRLRIAGTEGIVEVVEEATAAELMTPRSVERLALPPGRDLFAEFVASIHGGGECIVTPADSFRMTEVALKARHAADTGTIVEL
jgi:predicted dehydrogenase